MPTTTTPLTSYLDYILKREKVSSVAERMSLVSYDRVYIASKYSGSKKVMTYVIIQVKLGEYFLDQ